MRRRDSKADVSGHYCTGDRSKAASQHRVELGFSHQRQERFDQQRRLGLSKYYKYVESNKYAEVIQICRSNINMLEVI